MVLLAGFIAYAGDEIGRRVGRKHIRLFGLRPKTTALVVAVGSGMLISLVSLLGFALLNRQAIRNITEADVLRRNLSTLQGDIEQATVQIGRTQKERDKAQADAQKLELQRRVALKTQQKLQGQVGQLEQKRVTLEQDSKQLGMQNRSLDAKNRDLEQSSQVLNSQNRVLSLKNLDLEKSQRSLQSDRDILLERGQQLRFEVSSLEQTKLELDQRAQNLEEQVNTLASSVYKYQKDMQESNDKLEKTQENLNLSRSELKINKLSLEKSLTDLNVSRSELQSNRLSLEKSRQDLKDVVDQKAELLQRSEELQLQVAELETARQDISSKNQSLAAANGNLVDENATLQQDLEEEQKKLEQAKERLDVLQADLQSQLKSIQNRVDDLLAQQEDLRKSTDAARLELEELNKARILLDQQNKVLIADNDRLKLAVSRQSAELSAQRSGEVVYFKGDLVYQQVIASTKDMDRALRQASQLSLAKNVTLSIGNSEKERLLATMREMGEGLLLLRAASNTVSGYNMALLGEVKLNAQIYNAGQPIQSKLISLGTEAAKTNDALRGQIEQLLKTTVNTLASQGVPAENIVAGGLSSDDIFELVGRLKALKGPVLIGLASRKAVRPSSQIELYPVILR